MAYARLRHALRFHGVKQTWQLIQGGALRQTERAPTSWPAIALPSETQAVASIVLPASDSPLASVIIPVHNQWRHTAACLQSLASTLADVSFEVIVVDDASADETADRLAAVEGVRMVRQPSNAGFIDSCNAGAAEARGKVLVFLNNDTVVTDGWLDALLQTFDQFPDTGIVGARLLFADGRLQECGGIVFSDGSAWKYGHGDQPGQPQYGFVCEADYVSGACLAIRRPLFDSLGGFDPVYSPAYYEDTDLCFKARAAGWSVRVQPGCTIYHHEGVSFGRDESRGLKRHQVINQQTFRKRWAEVLAEQPAPGIDRQCSDPVRSARFHRMGAEVLVIDATTPMPDHDSGSVRLQAILRLMVELGWRVSFSTAEQSWDGEYSRQLQRMGVEVLSRPAVRDLESWLLDHGRSIRLILVSRHYVLSPLLALLRRCCPDARLVFDTVDLHFLREQRQAELSGQARQRVAAEQTRQAELALVDASDTTLVVSPVEQALLADIRPSADVRVLSNIHEPGEPGLDWAERHGLLFVGGFQHPPNVDAAEWLLDEILPRIRRQLPEVCLHLVGSRMPESLARRDDEGLRLHGYVPDLSGLLRMTRLSVAPLRYGAGVKGKINQAMAWGLPVVATPCAVEGMYLEPGVSVLTGDTADELAEAVVRVYQDETLWRQLSLAGRANVERYFSPAAARRTLQSLLDASLPQAGNAHQ